MTLRDLIDRIGCGGETGQKAATRAMDMLRRNGLNYDDSILFINGSRERRGFPKYDPRVIESMLYAEECEY